jgi:hypothetical protein
MAVALPLIIVIVIGVGAGFVLLEHQQSSPSPDYYTVTVHSMNDAAGNPVILHEYRNAVNVSWDTLYSFLLSDDTNNLSYVYPSFTCANFAEQLQSNAEAHGIKCGIVGVYTNIGNHALNVFYTTDRGFVFIDDSNNNNTYANIASLSNLSLVPQASSEDYVAYIQNGSPYGTLPLSLANQFDYQYYVNMSSRYDSYLAQVNTYNVQATAFVEAVEEHDEKMQSIEARTNQTYQAELNQEADQLVLERTQLMEQSASLNSDPESKWLWREPSGGTAIVMKVDVYW